MTRICVLNMTCNMFKYHIPAIKAIGILKPSMSVISKHKISIEGSGLTPIADIEVLDKEIIITSYKTDSILVSKNDNDHTVVLRHYSVKS